MGWEIGSERDILCIPLDILDPEIKRIVEEKYNNFIEHGWESTDGDECGICIGLPHGYQVSAEQDFDVLINKFRNGYKIKHFNIYEDLGYYLKTYCERNMEDKYPDFYKYFDTSGNVRPEYFE